MNTVRPVMHFQDLKVHTLCNGKFKENCYVVESTRTNEGLVIDSGGEAEFLIGSIAKLGLTVTRMLLTHGHFDHLGAVDELVGAYDVSCEAHIFEKKLVRQASTYAYRFARLKQTPTMRLRYFESCDTFAWAGANVRALHTPGHTSGSVCYVLNDAAVFTGDTLFHSAVGPSIYPESDPEALLDSVEMILSTLPNECVIFPGHGKPWTIGEARIWWQGASTNPPCYGLFGEKLA